MQEFRSAERLGVQVAGLLELERSLARDGERRPTADGDQALGAGQGIERAVPILVGGFGEPIRQPSDRIGEAFVGGPAGEEPQQGRERRDECLGRRHAQLGPGAHRQHDVASLGERAVGRVDDGCGDRAGGLGATRHLDQVVAAAGLRDREKQLAGELQVLAIDTGDVGRGCSDGQADVALDQMLAEGRGMRRAAARAGHHDLWGAALEAPDEIAERLHQVLHLARHCLGGLADLPRHLRLCAAHDRVACSCPCVMRSARRSALRHAQAQPRR